MPDTVASELPENQSAKAIAPLWHTAAVLVALFGYSALSAHFHGVAPRRFYAGKPHTLTAGYLIAALFEWLLVAFLWFGVRLRGATLRTLLGNRWVKPLAFFRDLGIAFVFLIASNVILGICGRLLKAATSRAVRDIVPHALVEVWPFLLLALTAGICEEIIFRGYLQRQLAAFTKSAAAGIILQGVVFGAAHAYQGLTHMILIAVFGCLFGLLAIWRQNLRPGMIAHFLQDGILGLLISHRLQ